jgi:hypothetical protein
MAQNLIRYFVLISLLILTAFCFQAFGANKLTYLGKEDGYTISYDKGSIRKIDTNIMEVSIINTIGGGTTKTQLRADCNTHNVALGSTYDLMNKNWKFVDDFSKNGWRWYSPTSKAEKKVSAIICTGH